MSSTPNNDVEQMYQELTQAFSPFIAWKAAVPPHQGKETTTQGFISENSFDGVSSIMQQPVGTPLRHLLPRSGSPRTITCTHGTSKRNVVISDKSDHVGRCDEASAYGGNSFSGKGDRHNGSSAIEERLTHILRRHRTMAESIELDNASASIDGLNEEIKHLTTMEWSPHAGNGGDEVNGSFPTNISSSSSSYSCWLCGAPCSNALGWLNAPNIFRRPIVARARPHLLQANDRSTTHSTTISLLTLCRRCGDVCDSLLNAPYEEVLRIANEGNRMAAARTPLFICFLRSYKSLIHFLASEAKLDNEGAETFAECPLETRVSILQRMIGMVESYVRVEGHASCDGNVRGSIKTPSDLEERHLYERELEWLRKQLHMLGYTGLSHKNAVEGPPPNGGNGVDDHEHSTYGHAVISEHQWTIPELGAVTSRSTSLHPNERLSPLLDSRQCRKDTLIVATPQDGQLVQEHEKRRQELVAEARERGSRALDKMIERAVTYRLKRIHNHDVLVSASSATADGTRCHSDGDSGEDKAVTAATATNVYPKNMENKEGVQPSVFLCGGKDADNILMQYFEGKLDKVPRLTIYPHEVSGTFRERAVTATSPSVLRDSGDGQLQMAQTRKEQESILTMSNDLPFCLHTVDNGMIEFTALSREELMKRLRKEIQRRGEAERALRESNAQIAVLEKATDHMSEVILSHRMNSILANHLSSMHQLHRSMVQNCVEITVQKSLFFADEMVILMRQAQNWFYSRPIVCQLGQSARSSDTITSEEERDGREGDEEETEKVRRMNYGDSARTNDGGKKEGIEGRTSVVRDVPITQFPVSLHLKPLHTRTSPSAS